MRYKHIFLIFAALMAIATGCKDESWHHDGPEKKYGILSFESMNFEISGIDQQDSSRSEGTDNFVVEIYGATGIVDRYSYSTLPDKIELEVGDYSVKVRTSEIYKAAWEKPYYEGLQNVTISENSTTEVEKVICSLSNIKVSIAIAEDLRKLMANDCKVHVIANDEGELEFTLDDIDNGKAGYFEYTNSSKTLVATLTGTVDGKPLSLQAIYTDLEPGQHRIIYYSVKIVDPDDPNNPGTDPEDPNKPGTTDPDDPNKPGTDPEDPNKPGTTDPDDPNNPGTDPEDPNKPGTTDPDDPNNPGTDPEDPNKPGTTDPDDPNNPGSTTGFIKLPNGLTIEVSVKTVDLNMTYPGEYYDPITGIIRPGDDDPDYTPPTAKPEDPQKPPVDLTENGDGPTEPENPNPPIEPIDPTPVDPEDPDNPTPEEPDDPTPPQPQIAFSASELKFDTPNKYTTSLDGKVFIHADAGIASLILNITSSNPGFADIGNGLSGLDFAKPDDAKELGDEFNIAYGSQVKDQTDVTFDITQPMGLLKLFPGTHNFIITVTDNSGNTKEVTLTIVTD